MSPWESSNLWLVISCVVIDQPNSHMLPFSQPNRCRRCSKDLGILRGLKRIRDFDIQSKLHYFCSSGNYLISCRSCDQVAVELFNPQNVKGGIWNLPTMKGLQFTAPVSQNWESETWHEATFLLKPYNYAEKECKIYGASARDEAKRSLSL